MRLYVIAFVSVLVLLASCKTIEVTPDEYKAIEIECQSDELCMMVEEEQLLDEKREQMIYEREDRRLREREQILGLIIACKATNNILVVKTWGASKLIPRRRKGPLTLDDIPKRAQLIDYMCITPDSLRNIIRQRAERAIEAENAPPLPFTYT